MNNQISFQLLVLNDLFNNHVIDKDIYYEATKRITSIVNPQQNNDHSKLVTI